MKVISLRSFLQNIEKVMFQEGNFVVCFRSKEFPSLFFSLILKKITALFGNIFSIDVCQRSLSEIQATLATSFLGTTTLYWLRNVSDLDRSTKRALISSCAVYQGPHKIILFLTDDDTIPAPSWLCVEVPEMVGKEEALLIALLYSYEISASRVAALFDSFGSAYMQLPPDTICMFLYYAALMGKQESDLSWYVQKLIIPKQSLFSVSQYFFEKNGHALYALWSTVLDQYELVFWSSFWSDQLWRATEYIEKMREGMLTEKNKKELRLPFSFTQKTWQKYTVAELQRAHEYVYDLDVRFKSGGGDIWLLDHFYTKFLANVFK